MTGDLDPYLTDLNRILPKLREAIEGSDEARLNSRRRTREASGADGPEDTEGPGTAGLGPRSDGAHGDRRGDALEPLVGGRQPVGAGHVEPGAVAGA